MKNRPARKRNADRVPILSTKGWDIHGPFSKRLPEIRPADPVETAGDAPETLAHVQGDSSSVAAAGSGVSRMAAS